MQSTRTPSARGARWRRLGTAGRDLGLEPKEGRAELEQRVQDFRERRDREATLASDLERLEYELGHQQARHEEWVARAGEAGTAAASKAIDVRVLESQRSSLLGGGDARAFEGRFRALQADSGDRLREAQKALNAAERAHAHRETLQQAAQNALVEQKANHTKRLDEAKRAWTELGTSRAALESLFEEWPAERVREERQRLSALRQSLAAKEGELTGRQRDLEAHRETDHSGGEASELEAEVAKYDDAVTVLEQERAGLRAAENAEQLKLATLRELRSEREGLLENATPWLDLGDLIGSSDGKKLRTFAQGLTLDQLVSRANRHLENLAKRFQLRRVGDLDLSVVDRDNAGEQRAVHTLSGGETFLVSLALALALSSLFDDQVQTRSLFIDEGFGSLDLDTLDVALAALEALHAQGRQVVVISHVQGLAERFDTSVQVRRRGSAESYIDVTSRGDNAPRTAWIDAAE